RELLAKEAFCDEHELNAALKDPYNPDNAVTASAAVRAIVAALSQQPEARGVVDASILQEAGDVLEAVAMSGVSLPNNWRWPLADELHGMAAALTGERNG